MESGLREPGCPRPQRESAASRPASRAAPRERRRWRFAFCLHPTGNFGGEEGAAPRRAVTGRDGGSSAAGHGMGILGMVAGHPLQLAQPPALGPSLCPALPGGHQPVSSIPRASCGGMAWHRPACGCQRWMAAMAGISLAGVQSVISSSSSSARYFLVACVFRGWPLVGFLVPSVL